MGVNGVRVSRCCRPSGDVFAAQYADRHNAIAEKFGQLNLEGLDNLEIVEGMIRVLLVGPSSPRRNLGERRVRIAGVEVL